MSFYNDNRPVVAVFDFDRTITDRHTFWRFLVFLIGPVKFWAIAVTLIPTTFRFLTKKIDMMSAREVMIKRCMTGVSYDEYLKKGVIFADKEINNWLDSDAIKKLRWHQESNHRCLLISNSADCYLEPWSKSMGFAGVSGSKFEQKGNKLTGKLVGEHCQGPEKVVRLKELVGDISNFKVYAYGDSDSDKDILSVAAYPFYRNF